MAIAVFVLRQSEALCIGQCDTGSALPNAGRSIPFDAACIQDRDAVTGQGFAICIDPSRTVPGPAQRVQYAVTVDILAILHAFGAHDEVVVIAPIIPLGDDQGIAQQGSQVTHRAFLIVHDLIFITVYPGIGNKARLEQTGGHNALEEAVVQGVAQFQTAHVIGHLLARVGGQEYDGIIHHIVPVQTPGFFPVLHIRPIFVEYT